MKKNDLFLPIKWSFVMLYSLLEANYKWCNCSKAELEALFWKGKYNAFLLQSKGMYENNCFIVYVLST